MESSPSSGRQGDRGDDRQSGPQGGQQSGRQGESQSSRQAEWEARYASVDRLWSGRPNDWLPELAAEWEPGRSLDLGCGEGADVLWLASRGWDAVGLDLSPTAIARLRSEAEAAGVASRVMGLVRDVAREGLPAGGFDLVTSFYVHGGPGPGSLDLEALLSEAAGSVVPGGRLLVAVHCVNPPWHRHCALAYRPDELRAGIVGTADWETVHCEERWREVMGPDGEPGRRSDAVVCLHRPAA